MPTPSVPETGQQDGTKPYPESFPQQPYAPQAHLFAPQYSSASGPYQPGQYVPGEAPTAQYSSSAYQSAQFPADSGAPGGLGYASSFGPAAAQATTQEAKPRRRRFGTVALLTAGLLVGGVVGGGVGGAVVGGFGSTPIAAGAGSSQSITVNNPQDATLVTSIAAVASPSVVTISASSGQTAASGSGVVVDGAGYIVTNNHVATIDGATGNAELSVQTSDGRLLAATFVAGDPVLDLAIIKVEDTTLTPITFADSDALNVGDVAVAIGAPLGLSDSVTEGVVSALDRGILVSSSAVPEEVESDGTQEDSPYNFWRGDPNSAEGQTTTQGTSSVALPVIQTDAAINPGNSGGALVDQDGALIGINVAIAGASSGGETAGNIGVGFSLPSNLVKRVTEQLISDGQVAHGFLGASVTDPTAADSSVAGAYVAQLTAGGPAAQAGIQAGDVITSFGGHRVSSSTDLTAQIRALEPGTQVEAVLVRGGQEQTVRVTVGELEQ
ncbi:serine protease [Pseudoclavibacter sp. AY1F1]|uniref:trypsin-like peptidase domain-containing protein n=1 Tax=Pseudoclavibacter sp. AY1F1 TaxID=2080583 RepID=UPI000CE7EF7F|nr:trypsin-like peptidase domain-containing protein [Pseudoclavibacter sp. AY1F1]PPF44932.1 serine protease [Pseudoclavibacter sp. AY1F1]